MASITITSAGADQYATITNVKKGAVIQIGGTFVGTLSIQRRPAASLGLGHPWVTIETQNAPIVRVAEEKGLADYRVGTVLSGDYTSGTIYCNIQAANVEG